MKTKLIKLWHVVEIVGLIVIFFEFFFAESEFMMVKMGILTIIFMLTVNKIEGDQIGQQTSVGR